MKISLGKSRTDIIRYILIAGIFISLMCMSWNDGTEMHTFFGYLLVAAAVNVKYSKKYSWLADILLPLQAFAVCTYINHQLNLYSHYTLRVLYETDSIIFYTLFIQGWFAIAVEFFVLMIIYFLLRSCRVSSKIAAIAAPLPTFLLCLADYFVIRFKGNELSPWDLTGIKTAVNVMGNYTFRWGLPYVLALGPMLLYIISVIGVKVEEEKKFDVKKLIIHLAATAIMTVSLFTSVSSICKERTTVYFGDKPSVINGYITNFAMIISDYRIATPEGYSRADYADIYDVPAAASNTGTNVIIIMNESLADLSVYEDILGNYSDPLSYWHSMEGTDNVRSGYAYSSVFGGNTANSEFEVLTGLSVAGLPVGSIPYSTYLNSPVYSLPRYLSELGYTTTAMHPYEESGWNRTVVYPNLGFDSMMFIDDFTFETSDIARLPAGIDGDVGFISDESAYRNVLDLIEARDSDAPEFYFLVTIQNHGGYDIQSELSPVDEYVAGTPNDLSTNIYLTNTARSDRAVEYLISELSRMDERYAVLIFGDHQPVLGLDGSDSDSDTGNRRWIIPYLIWTNYDMPDDLEGRDITTSINYLGLDVMKAAGIPMSPYFETIESVRDNIPVINATGYYSNATSSWHPLNDVPASSEDSISLNEYYRLQYFALFDSEFSK